MKLDEIGVIANRNTKAIRPNTSKNKYQIIDDLLNDYYSEIPEEIITELLGYIQAKIDEIDNCNSKIRKALDCLSSRLSYKKLGYESIEELIENEFNDERHCSILSEHLKFAKLERKLLFDDPIGTISYFALKLLLNLKDEKLIREVWDYAMKENSLHDYGYYNRYPGAYFIEMAIDELLHSKTKSTWNDGTAEIIAKLIIPSIVEEMSRYVSGKTEKRIKAVLNSLELQLIEQRDKL